MDDKLTAKIVKFTSLKNLYVYSIQRYILDHHVAQESKVYTYCISVSSHVPYQE